jgi:hypothetical protein
MLKLKINPIRDAVQGTLWRSPASDLLEHLLLRGAKIAVFAGAIRDLVLSCECGFTHVKPRDWDIGVAGISHDEFNGILKEVGGSKNKYGGFKLFSETAQPWEIWRREETVGLLKTGAPLDMKNVLRSFVLSCNAIACDLNTGNIYDCGALRSIFACELTILDDAIMHDRRVFAAKALSLTFRRPFELTEESSQFVTRYLAKRNLIHELAKS